MENFTPADIEKICNKMQFKYCELTSSTKKYGGFNQTPAKLKEKINSIKKFLQELPDDIYFLNCKIFPKGDIFTYKFNKGNLSENINTIPQIYPVMQQPTPLEKFQTLDEWKKQEKLINDLQQEIAFLKMQAKFADTLKEQPQEEKQNPILGFAENVLPQFMPILDRYFNIKEKEIELKSRQPKPQQTIKKVIKQFRPLPNIADEKNLQNYFIYFMNLNDTAAEQELNFVETNNKELFNLLISKFYTNEEI